MQEPGLRRLREGARLGLFKNKVGRMGDAERKRDDETNALLDALDEAIAWTDSFCAEEISIKEASQDGFICESSELSSATTPGKVADLGSREEQRELQRD